jgi:Trk K+ transport system NAD-binding subunit
MPGHVIVCGMGDVGYRVVELLHRLGEPVQVVTDKVREERRLAAEARGIRVVLGDARSEHLLIAAGLFEAKALLAATDQDLVNIEIALDVRRHCPDLPIVLRVFDEQLARHLEPALQVRRCLVMSALAAPSFAAAALGESVLVSFPVGDVAFVTGQARGGGPLAGLRSVGALAGTHRLHTLLREHAAGLTPLPAAVEPIEVEDRLTLLARKADWDSLCGAAEEPPPAAMRRERLPWPGRLSRASGRAVAAWRREPLLLRVVLASLLLLIPAAALFLHFELHLKLADALFYTVTNLYGSINLSHPSPSVRFLEACLLILGSISVATLYSLFTSYLVGVRLRRLLGGVLTVPRGGHVIVVGLGRVGARILEELIEAGVPVVAIDADPGARLLPSVRTMAPVVTGDARSADILAQAHLASARAVVAVTSDDAVNLGISLAAKRASPRVRTVVRLFDADFARKVESVLGIDASMSASRIAAPTFAAAVLAPQVSKALIVRDHLFVLSERQAGADWAGMTPAELRAGKGIHVLMRGAELAAKPSAAATAAGDEEPLRAEETLVAVSCRSLAPSWADQEAATATARRSLVDM